MFFKKKPSLQTLLPPPVSTEGKLYSMAFSAHDDKSFPTPSLIEVSLQAIVEAKNLSLSDLSSRLNKPPYYPDVWPGEHYRLLAGFVKVLKPKLIIEIGTAKGLSSLAMKKYLPQEGKIITFDLIGWQNYEGAVLQDEDFKDKRLEQILEDLSNRDTFFSKKSLLEKADLIFIDATHDGDLEEKIVHNLSELSFSSPPYVILDDIRFWTMLKMWREIPYPKLDLTSFGHWSGTGLFLLDK